MDESNSKPTDHNNWKDAMKIRCEKAAENSPFDSKKAKFFSDGQPVTCENKLFLCKQVTEDDFLHATIDQIKRALPYNIWNRVMLSETILCEMRKRSEYYESFYEDNQGLFTNEEYSKSLESMGKADAFNLQPMLYATAVVLGCHFLVVIPENEKLTPYTFGPEETYNADRVLYIGFENNRFWSLYPCK